MLVKGSARGAHGPRVLRSSPVNPCLKTVLRNGKINHMNEIYFMLDFQLSYMFRSCSQEQLWFRNNFISFLSKYEQGCLLNHFILYLYVQCRARFSCFQIRFYSLPLHYSDILPFPCFQDHIFTRDEVTWFSVLLACSDFLFPDNTSF